ncbi:glycosyltransferase [Nocardioides sp. CER19]|uniref:glycosyltransferase n=1 Tax=Nocardioides sp. CER19 TaxID=3038538 RepID=UPI002449A149|nr:glycosyltransferase [Nocardioides sp. CER19]MDH2414826.1 glycosyltransferase [Nocardioides sp. CER19]
MTSVVLSLAFHTWADGVPRQMSWSPDRVAQQLCDDPTVDTLLVADPLRSQLARLRRRAVAPDEGFPAGPSRRFVQPRRWRRGDTHDRAGSTRAYQRLDRWLADRNEEAGWPQAVLVTCHPVLAAVADRSRWADVVYYGWDDWLTYPPMAAARDLMAWSYAEMATRDVKVVGVTQAIVDRVGASRSAVVPNGISLADYASPAQTPDWFEAVEKPVAFYAGAMEDRVDVEALEDLARDLPDWSLVLVGHMQDPTRFERLLQQPNVVFHELQPRPEVLAMMAAADVCLVPHRRTPMSVAMSPLKLYEYLAAGAPVVAADLEPMRGVSDRCLLVEPGARLAPTVRRAAQLPRATADEIARFRGDNDWSSRYRDWAAAALGTPRTPGRAGDGHLPLRRGA